MADSDTAADVAAALADTAPAHALPDVAPPPTNALGRLSRAAQFWSRAIAIYASYKRTQVIAAAALAAGRDPDKVKAEIWEPQHRAAGEAMYSLATRLEGFYIKVRIGFLDVENGR